MESFETGQPGFLSIWPGLLRVGTGISLEPGDVIVVPPLMTHAFAAEQGSSAEVLIIIAPGVERFDYFRQLTRIARGEEKPESLKDLQNLYDNFFLNSPEWELARKR